MYDLALVALGCALGGMARFGLSGMVGRWIGETFPWGTMVVNVSGAFAIGIMAAANASEHAWLSGSGIWHVAVIGFLGSYTTVSSVSLQTLALARDGELWRAAGNILLSVGLCLPAAGTGFIVGTQLLGTG